MSGRAVKCNGFENHQLLYFLEKNHGFKSHLILYLFLSALLFSWKKWDSNPCKSFFDLFDIASQRFKPLNHSSFLLCIF